MKRLKFLVLMVFLMILGVLCERASIKVYAWGSKVDWDQVHKVLFKQTITDKSEGTDGSMAVSAKSESVALAIPADRGSSDMASKSDPLPDQLAFASAAEIPPLISDPPVPEDSVPPTEPEAKAPTPAVRPTPAVVTQEPIVVDKATPALNQTPENSVPMLGPVNINREPDSVQYTVCRLRSVPAANIAATLQKILLPPPHSAVVESESMSNCLLIRGAKDKIEEARTLVAALDRPAWMVRLEVRVSEIASEKVKKTDAESPAQDKPGEDSAKGGLQAVSATEEGNLLLQASVATLDNQPAQIMMGCNEPRIVAVNRGPTGVSNNSIQTVNLGTKINLTPRVVDGDCVALSFKISDSRSGPTEEGVVIAESKDGPTVKTPRDEQFIAETTVQLLNGKTLLLGEMNHDGKAGKERLISVTAHILRPGEEK